MNKLEVFNKVKQHLLTQNKRSVVYIKGDTCLYRGDNGMSCAIGILIPDEIYNRHMEGNDVYELLQSFPVIALHLDLNGLEDTEFLSELQNIHDHNSPEKWPTLLQKSAEDHKL
jgi:hypothetical protein